MLAEHADVEVNELDRALTHAELVRMIRGRHAILANIADRIDAEVCAAADECKIIANYGVGFDNIDLEAAKRAGIAVTNTPGVLTETTADLTWSLILAVARRLIEGDNLVRSGKWQGWEPMQLHGWDVHHATLGIVGAGRIGRAVGKRATGFEMNVLYVDQADCDKLNALGAKRCELDECLRRADFVSLHVSYTPANRHLIGREQLALMKPSACLINTARGPVVDEQALVEALRENRLAGAGFDVYEHEPRLTEGLAELKNVVLLPHLGSASQATRRQMALMAATNVIEVLQGNRPPNPVQLP